MSQAHAIYDLAVVGGGINGCGIVRDAAGRGLKVLLAEQGDLAQGTSSASTKLIHGGLRYLEYYDFKLVREALNEREILLKNAPHIIWPLRFVLPHHKHLRPAWFLRLGLFIYDHLGGRKLLPPTQTLDLRTHPVGTPLIDTFQKGFEYSDCWVDDARLVLLNALDAQARGADIRVRTRCTAARRLDNVWEVDLLDVNTHSTRKIHARILVNAAGPWVDHVLQNIQPQQQAKKNVRLVRGSHIIVPKIHDHDRAYIFQNKDGRIIFAIPYEQAFTLLGTTDRDHHTSLEQVQIEADEIQYICEAASVYFKQPIKPEDIVWTYSGVRPLYDDGASAAQEATRDYILTVKDQAGQAPLLTIFGGKITTYRHLAEDALHQLQPWLPHAGTAWTKTAALPGGDFAVNAVEQQVQTLQATYPFISEAWARSLIRRYGTRAYDCLGDAKRKEDLGKAFGASLSEREIRFLIAEEWAQNAEDVLWRRSKLGLHMNEVERQAVAEWFAELN